MRRIFALLLLPLFFSSCDMDPIGLQLEAGWQAKSVAVWRNMRPDMMALSANGTWLYISCETRASVSLPSLVVINLKNGRRHVLVSGLMRADALKFAPDGSLWIGEEFPEGLIWRIADVDKLPPDQTVERMSMYVSDDAIAPYRPAGRFAHEGLTFSADHRFAYLADEDKNGAIYRLELKSRRLDVLDGNFRWREVRDPDDARAAARQMQAASFNRLEDMETLPDGRIVLAETDAGRVLVMQDHGEHATVETLLQDGRIVHPDNLAWDDKRHLLWITDDSKPSALWVWDGREATRIALHRQAEITGVLPVGDDIYINLQGGETAPELTVKLYTSESSEFSAR
ncbi:MAG: hypothetical protein Q9M25_04925 [Mariprofundaceae bacterium]|nr:hypothetical protein [Mariprofundaceae bacterium]